MRALKRELGIVQLRLFSDGRFYSLAESRKWGIEGIKDWKWKEAPTLGQKIILLSPQLGDRILLEGDYPALLQNVLGGAALWTGDAVMYLGEEKQLSGKFLHPGARGIVCEVSRGDARVHFQGYGSSFLPFHHFQRELQVVSQGVCQHAVIYSSVNRIRFPPV